MKRRWGNSLSKFFGTSRGELSVIWVDAEVTVPSTDWSMSTTANYHFPLVLVMLSHRIMPSYFWAKRTCGIPKSQDSTSFMQISLLRVKMYYFCSKWMSKELIHAATTRDLKNYGRGVERESLPPDIPVPPYKVSAPLRIQVRCVTKCVRILHKMS